MDMSKPLWATWFVFGMQRYLFASAYTLKEDGMWVDVLYAGLKRQTKSKLNIIGIIFLAFHFVG